MILYSLESAYIGNKSILASVWREKPSSICCYCCLTLFSCLEKEQQEAIEHIDEVQNEIDRYVELY